MYAPDGYYLAMGAVDQLPLYKYARFQSALEFRLLELYQGAGSDEIVCQIHHRLSNIADRAYDSTSYEALSYTWGGEDVSIRIASNRGGNFHTRFTIQRNLHMALRRLRLNDRSRFIWADAICIDQSYDNEKDHQVANMARIYTNAERVCIWLGPDEDSSPLAFKLLENILQLKDVDDLVHSNAEANIDAWAAFFSLLRRRWFTRRWVVQELALAKKAVIFCGEQPEVQWTDFADAIQIFEGSAKDINQLFKQSSKYHHSRNHLGNVAQLGAVCLVKIANSVLRSFDDSGKPHRHLTLEALVSTLTAFGSQDCRDTIYSVLALAKDANPKPQKDEFTTSEANSRPMTPSVLKRAFIDGEGDETIQANTTSKRARTDVTQSQVPSFAVGSQERDVVNAPIPALSFPRSLSPLPEPSQSTTTSPSLPPTSLHISIPTINPTISSTPDPQLLSAKNSIVGRFAMSLKNKVAWKTLEVNYRKPVAEIYKDFVALALRSSKDRQADSPLDIILRPWAPVLPTEDDESKPLPSWMREIKDAPFGEEAYGNSWIYNRVNADPLVGAAEAKRKLYNASRSATGKMELSQADPSNMELLVDGFIFDTIEETAESSIGGAVPQEWMEFAGWRDVTKPPPNELWRTLVADRDTTGEPVQSLYERAFRYICQKKVPHADLIPRNILEGLPPKAAVVFVERMEAVIWRRKMIRTRLFKRLGLAHKGAKSGDKICILYGCSVPVVLREHHEAGEQFFKVVGDCYVHGIMDGEAFDLSLPTENGVVESEARLLKHQKRQFVLH